MAKFHEDSIILYGVSQTSEANSAIKSVTDLGSATVTTTLATTDIVGVGTKFEYKTTPGDGLGDLTVGGYVLDNTGAVVGRVATITDQTNAVLEANSLLALTAETYTTGLGPKNALAALNLNYNTELTTEAHKYVGDSQSRDEETVITDKYAKFDCEVFLPKLGTIGGSDPTEDEVPMTDWFQSSGMSIVLSSGAQGYVDITNSSPTNEFMSIEVRLSSPDIATDKCYSMKGCQGMIDFDGTVGTRATLKFTYVGNLVDVTQKTPIVPDFQDQKAGHALSIKSTTVELSNLEVYVTATEPSEGSTNFCFDKVIAPNCDGFAYNRYLNSCEDGWSKGAEPTDVTATIIEDSADAIYNPDDHLEDNHRLAIEYGNVTGNTVKLTWHKLQLAGITPSTVAKFRGQDLAFRNVGTFDIRLS